MKLALVRACTRSACFELHKGTDTYGLLGKVKSVTEEHECLKFDQSGNLVYQKNSFDKETTYTYASRV